MNLPAFKLIIVGLYRSPSSNPKQFYEILDKLLEAIFRDYGNKVKIILAGDLNINYKDKDFNKGELSSIMKSFGVVNLVNDYTRITKSTKSSIDYIITNLNDYAISCNKVAGHSWSDHTGQLLKFYPSQSQETIFQYQRDNKENNIENLCKTLGNMKWNNIHNNSNLNIHEKWSLFIETVRHQYNKICPLRKKPVNNKKKY